MAQVSPDAPTLLGRPPLCESSAAIVSPWSERVLVADNEVHEQLFTFLRNEAILESQRPLPLPKKHRPRDIEALVGLSDSVLVVGSHSRNRECEVRPKRMRIREVGWDVGRKQLKELAFQDNGDLTASFASSETCLETLFDAPPPELAEALCEALVLAEQEASERRCRTLDIEGASLVQERVWLGLRTPLLDGDAVMLRLVWPSPRLRIDAVVTVPLDGQGIRELSPASERDRGTPEHDGLWILSGPLEDGGQHRLWAMDTAELLDGTTANPAPTGREIPKAAEALVTTPLGLIVLTDGAEGEDEMVCEEPSTQHFLPRSTPRPVEEPARTQ